MIHPITPNVNNSAIYYGATLATDKNAPPKTDVTNSSASASARGDRGHLKTGVTSSSAVQFARGIPPALEANPVKNITPPETIAAVTASVNTPSVNLLATMNAESEKEFREAKAGKTKETPALKAKVSQAELAKDALKVLASHEQNYPTIITLRNSVRAEAVISAYK
ncbi:MAG TPA: hypothetical protein DIW44_08495 [Anaerolineaceae bacterium]|nr:hypothetical protein [Anaerolineaceae bacterium]